MNRQGVDVERNTVPIITIDGPSSSGKGTVSRIIARRLGWHFLDSGALYRIVALAARHHAVSWSDEETLKTLAAHLDVVFEMDADGLETRIVLEGEDVTGAIRTEECGKGASEVAVLPGVRLALLDRQRAFHQPPGLVADGRDMGTVVFPDAGFKVFLTASAEERARRRYKQLNEKGMTANLENILHDLVQRDARDAARSVSPLRPASDAIVIDTTTLTVEGVVTRIMEFCGAEK